MCYSYTRNLIDGEPLFGMANKPSRIPTRTQRSKREKSLAGKILIATPMVRDERFERSLIYVIAHSTQGAMGIIFNKVVESLTFPFLLSQLGIKAAPITEKQRIHFGGPVETRRGFVLHSSDYNHNATVAIDDNICLTATIDIVRDIATLKGPKEYLLALGYAGWGRGQLENELSSTAWIEIPGNRDLIFSPNDHDKWQRAKDTLGFNLAQISPFSGNA